jgi:hypothetical protein
MISVVIQLGISFELDAIKFVISVTGLLLLLFKVLSPSQLIFVAATIGVIASFI